jgi:hypothetical protein
MRLITADTQGALSYELPWRILSYDEWLPETADPILFSILEDEGQLKEWAVGEDRESEDENEGEPFWVVEVGGGSGPCVAGPEFETLAELASRAQDYVIDELQQAWPPCPGHTHPAIPVAEAEFAVWACPKTRRQIAPIGALNES